MPEPIEVDFSYVCDTQPYCLCAGEGSEECCCLPIDRSVLQTHCGECWEEVAAINFHTGERLPEGAVSSWTP